MNPQGSVCEPAAASRLWSHFFKWSQTKLAAATERAAADTERAAAETERAAAATACAAAETERAAAETARADANAKAVFTERLRAFGTLGNESLSAHARSAAAIAGRQEPKQVFVDVLLKGFPTVERAKVFSAWEQFLNWLQVWDLPAANVAERTHVHPVLEAMLACAVSGGLNVWHEGRHEQEIPWRSVVPDFSCTELRDLCLSTIGCLFCLEAKKPGDMSSAVAQSLNYGTRTIYERFLEASLRGTDPSKIWTIVAGSDLRYIAFSVIRSGAPQLGRSYQGVEPCAVETVKLPLLGPDFRFESAWIAAFVAGARACEPPEGFQAVVRTVRGLDALTQDQEHQLLAGVTISRDGVSTSLSLVERLGVGGTSDVYRVAGALRCAKIPRHSSAHIEAMFYNENAVLTTLEALRNPSIPTVESWTRTGDTRILGASHWPVLLVFPVGVPLSRAVHMDDNANARVQLAKTVMRGLMDVMEVCHGMGYAHCDLRPENVVLVVHDDSREFCARIERVVPVDWGLSQRCGSTFSRPGQQLYAPSAILAGAQKCFAGPWVDLIGAAFTAMTILSSRVACHAPWFTAPQTPSRQEWFDENRAKSRRVAAIATFVESLDGGRDALHGDYEFLRSTVWVCECSARACLRCSVAVQED